MKLFEVWLIFELLLSGIFLRLLVICFEHSSICMFQISNFRHSVEKCGLIAGADMIYCVISSDFRKSRFYQAISMF